MRKPKTDPIARAAMLQRIRERNAKRLCGMCDNPPVPGKFYCQACRDRQRAKSNELAKRRAAGKRCVRCGSPDPATSRLCEACRQKSNLYAKRHRDRRKRP